MDMHNWINTAGNWVEEYVIPPDFFPIAAGITFKTAFMAEAHWNRPTCLRYLNPQLLKDGKAIAAVVEEDGTPGEPGWRWRFYVIEQVTGPVQWRVETRDCAKVALALPNAGGMAVVMAARS